MVDSVIKGVEGFLNSVFVDVIIGFVVVGVVCGFNLVWILNICVWYCGLCLVLVEW